MLGYLYVPQQILHNHHKRRLRKPVSLCRLEKAPLVTIFKGNRRDCGNYHGVIGLYTPINYFGRYATCSHKDGGRSMFSLGKPLARRTTWYAYNYVGARKFKSCVLSHLQDGIFYKYAVLKHIISLWRNFFVVVTLSLWLNFFVAATPSLWPNFSEAATPCLADIHIQELWDAFPSLKNYLFLTIEKGHFKLAILFIV